MEDHRNKVSNDMQLYPRILVNVLVILVNVLVNLLVKLAKLRVRGAMGLRGAREEKKRVLEPELLGAPDVIARLVATGCTEWGRA